MPPQGFLVVFAIAWCVAVAYVATLLAAVARIKWLEHPERRLGLREVFSTPAALEGLGILFGQRHRTLADPLATRLVWAARALFAVALPLILYVFWQVFALAVTGRLTTR
jgi:hypothetical protein